MKVLSTASIRRKTSTGSVVSQGFTIVELLIVVVVIAILAAITIIGYNGISTQAKESALKSDLKQGATQLGIAKVQTGSYPSNTSGLKKSDTTSFQYSAATDTFCLTATSAQLAGKTFYITQDGAIQSGVCPGDSTSPAQDGSLLQAITAANCTTTRIMAIDARDNRTYWVQKLADGKCWMLTNLAYAGGGTNTYSDVVALSNGSAESTGSYTVAKYYIPTNANPTTNPTQPSSTTDGGTTNSQNGYLYNWCAAMGAQASTVACTNAATPAASTVTSICPAGWRLPTGNTSGEFAALNTAVNGGLTNTNAGLRSAWLAQSAGSWSSTFSGAGSGNALYWSSTAAAANTAYSPRVYTTSITLNQTGFKSDGFSVRCLAN